MPSGRTLLDKPCRTIVYDGRGNRVAETDYHYDDRTATCGAISGEAHGNLTQVVRQCFGIGRNSNTSESGCSNSFPTTSYTYEAGQVKTRTDAKGTTTYTYANGFVTQIDYPQTNGVGHVERFDYDYDNSQLTSKTGQNPGQKTSYEYADRFRRPTKVVNPAGGGDTTIAYDDTPPSPFVTQTTQIDAGNSLVTVTTSDGLGRVTNTQVGSGALATTVDMTYDGLGRLRTKSNPHRSSPLPTDGITTYDYDALGRVTLVRNPDGSTVSTSYGVSTVPSSSGYCTTVTDEAQKRRTSCTDALGRLTKVIEAPSN
jgi:hypothetical protein